MVNSIRSASTYFSKFFESVNNYTQDIHTEVSSRCASTSPCNSVHPPTYNTTPPPYEDALIPPSYSAAIGGLSMVDRTNRDFKIYERDLKALAIEWSRRKNFEYENFQGGPLLAPRRIIDMQKLFTFILQHKTCENARGAPACDCRSLRWAVLKSEWFEVMQILGIAVL